jgi:uroporphyrinogen-III synthase
MELLNGKRILVTRPEQQAHNLISLIEQHGGQAIAFPTLEILPTKNLHALKQQLENLKTYQWLIFISANAVNFAVQANSGKIQDFKLLKIAAVGKATAKTLESVGLSVDVVPETGFNSEALLTLPALQNLQNQRLLIVRGVGGRETLADELKKRGATVDYLEVYQRSIPNADDKTARVQALLEQQQLEIITITSGDALQNLVTMLSSHIDLLIHVTLVVVSERIKQIAQSIGFKNIVVSSSPDDMAILNTMIMLINGEGQWSKN